MTNTQPIHSSEACVKTPLKKTFEDSMQKIFDKSFLRLGKPGTKGMIAGYFSLPSIICQTNAGKLLDKMDTRIQ